MKSKTIHGKSVGIRIEFLYNEYEDMVMTNIVKKRFDAKEFVEEQNLGIYRLISFSIYRKFMNAFSTLYSLAN